MESTQAQTGGRKEAGEKRVAGASDHRHAVLSPHRPGSLPLPGAACSVRPGLAGFSFRTVPSPAGPAGRDS